MKAALGLFNHDRVPHTNLTSDQLACSLVQRGLSLEAGWMGGGAG